MGDFNIDIKNKSGDADDFVNIMASNFLKPTSILPTRITNHSSTIIDNILINSDNNKY
jgi:hypothetical protein